MKRWYVQLAILIIIGLLLGSTTFDFIRELRGAGNSEVFGWLGFTEAGVGISFAVMALLVLLICFDALWLLFFIVWLIRKKFHIESKDNTLYLP